MSGACPVYEARVASRQAVQVVGLSAGSATGLVK